MIEGTSGMNHEPRAGLRSSNYQRKHIYSSSRSAMAVLEDRPGVVAFKAAL